LHRYLKRSITSAVTVRPTDFGLVSYKKPWFLVSIFVGMSDQADVTNEMKVRLNLKQLQPSTKSL
jgi:hypothetical protein